MIQTSDATGLVLDAPAVDRLLTRSWKPTSVRLIAPAQAFATPAGARRRGILNSSSWKDRVAISDVEGIQELTAMIELQKRRLTPSQSSGLVIARREQASIVAKVCPVFLEQGRRLVEASRIVDVSLLWKALCL